MQLDVDEFYSQPVNVLSVDNANIFKNTQIYFDTDSLSVILENMRKRIFQFLQEDQQLKQEEAK